MRDTTTFMKHNLKSELQILLVEDNPGDAELLMIHLQRIPHFASQTFVVESLEDALNQLSGKTYDLCISDLGLPDSSGLETVAKLCESHGAVPLIVLTGNNDPEMGAAVVRAGAQDYLIKGQLDANQLSRVIRYTLERHRFQSRIREYENLLHASLDAMSAEVALLNSEGIILFANRSWRDRLEDVQSPFEDLRPGGSFFRACEHATPPSDQLMQGIMREIQASLHDEGAESKSWLDCVKDRSGRKCFEITITPFYHRGSRHIILSKEDITSRQDTEDQVKFQAMLLDQISDCVTVTDLDGKVTYANEASCKLLEQPLEDLRGKSVEGFGENTTRGASQREIIEETFKQGHWRGEIVNLDRHGREVLLDCRTQLVRNEQGQPVAMCGISTDITLRRFDEEQKESLQAELHHSQKLEAIGHLAGGVAHDFNNMLQAIIGNCELALMAAADNSELQEELLEIKTASEHSANLARQLLAFARKQAISPRQIDLNDAVSSMLKMLQRLIGENIQLDWNPHNQPVLIWMDPGQLDQILANMAVNARDAIRGQGTFKISVSTSSLPEKLRHPMGEIDSQDFSNGEKEYARITLMDNGCGMPPEVVERIFEPFFTTKPVGKGTGLGLSTVYGIIRQNHGFVEVSSHPGQGTTFDIYLRLHLKDSIPTLEKPKQGAAPKNGKGHILLVEDEMTILRIISKCLRNFGYSVTECNNPLKAIEVLHHAQQPMDLLITDVIMPDMNGRMLAQEVRKAYPDIPVLFMSGYSSDILAGEGFRSHRDHLLKKPFEVSALAQISSNGTRMLLNRMDASIRIPMPVFPIESVRHHPRPKRRMLKFFHYHASLWMVLALGAGSHPVHAEPGQAAATFIKRYCQDCHDEDVSKGDLDLTRIAKPEAFLSASDKWRQSVERTLAMEMPPEKADQPSLEERQAFAEEIESALRHAAMALDGAPGPSPIRRLSRYQYRNTVGDLLGINVDPSYMLPPDGAGGEGYDNAAETLFISPLHAEMYLRAAEEALGYALNESPARRRIFPNQPGKGLPETEAARRNLVLFLGRAFRRPVQEEETIRYLALYTQAREEDGDFQLALSFAYRAALVSPHFLFRLEQEPQGAEPQRIQDHELATRLSYFLWASMPDENLMRLAREGRLQDPMELQKQVVRMLADRRARGFAEDFTGQWLGIRELGGEFKPDPKAFPRYNQELEMAMKNEPTYFMQALLKENLPLTLLIDSDFSWLNNSLTGHYGIKAEGMQGSFKKVDLPGDSVRGGILTMAASLAVSSYPHRTSPVLRGKWLLEKVLGTAPPPPPPNVPPLEETVKQTDGLTLRDRLRIHRENPDCAGCHDRIDPVGFGLENFDAIGRFRTQDNGKPIDAHGSIPGGTEYDGPRGLKEALMKDPKPFVRHFVRQVYAYAMGRGLVDSDLPVLDRLVERLEKSNYAFHELILGIVESRPFQYRQAESKLDPS